MRHLRFLWREMVQCGVVWRGLCCLTAGFRGIMVGTYYLATYVNTVPNVWWMRYVPRYHSQGSTSLGSINWKKGPGVLFRYVRTVGLPL